MKRLDDALLRLAGKVGEAWTRITGWSTFLLAAALAGAAAEAGA